MAGEAAGGIGAAAMSASPWGAALSAAGNLAGALGDAGPSHAEANGNVYGGINFGDSAIANRNLPSFLANRLTGRPQVAPSAIAQTFGDMGYIQAAAIGGALLLTLLLLKRSKKNG